MPKEFPRKHGPRCVVAFVAPVPNVVAVIHPFAFPVLLAGLALALPDGVDGQEFFDNKPAPKSAENAAPVDPAKAIQRIEGTRFKLGLLEFDETTREIRIPAKVNMREGLLEYVLVHESGKVHESLFSTAVKPTELNVLMLLLNWKQSDAFFDYTEPERGGVPVKGAKNPPPSHVEVHVAWKDKDGKDHTCRVENWLHQVEKKAKITVEPFIYTGSRIMQDGQFLAEQTGSILALYVDPGSMVNNPRDGNDLDDVWINDPAVPEKDTPVTVIFKPTPPDGGDKKPDAEKKPDTQPKPSIPSKSKLRRNP